jgi:MFS superfamily sulfate permease-like transporter
LSQQLPEYPKRKLRADLVAGVTVAALAVPSAMGYASLAGLNPVAGLYALLLPIVAYALLGCRTHGGTKIECNARTERAADAPR